jgi:hypothetical protein
MVSWGKTVRRSGSAFDGSAYQYVRDGARCYECRGRNVVTLNITQAQAEAVAETDIGPRVDALAGRLFLDRVVGIFPDEAGRSYTKVLLLIHVINRGPATVVSDFNFAVRKRNGDKVSIGWVIDQSIIPRSTEPALPFRSVAYVAQNALRQGNAVDVYAYCALNTLDYGSVDRTTWEATFEDAHGANYTARPSTGMIDSAV